MTECIKCQHELTNKEESQGFSVCRQCYRENPNWLNEHKEIQKFMRSEIGELRTMVSLSRKGKPRKQASGFHLVAL